jgi:hypothetical protein
MRREFLGLTLGGKFQITNKHQQPNSELQALIVGFRDLTFESKLLRQGSL